MGGVRPWIPGLLAAPGGGGLETIVRQAATDSDGTGAPLDGAADTLILPFDPAVMFVTAGWDLLRGKNVRSSGHSLAQYSRVGGSNVLTIFGGVNWYDFDNIVNAAAEAPASISVGLVTSNLNLSNAFTLEYTPATRTLGFLAANDPASTWIPRLRSLLITGAR